MAEMGIDPDKLPDAALATMGITREEFSKIREFMKAREAMTPAVGDEAPDFEIEKLSAAGQRTGEMFHLADTRGKPVGLIFGSYT